MKRHTEPTLFSDWDTEDNGKSVKGFVLERSHPCPATRLKEGSATGKGKDVKAVSIIQEKKKGGFFVVVKELWVTFSPSYFSSIFNL